MMEQKQIINISNLAHLAFILAAVALSEVLIASLFGCWHVVMTGFHIVTGIGAVACAVVAYLKDEDKKKSTLALILAFFSFVLPPCVSAEKSLADQAVADEIHRAHQRASRIIDEGYNYDYNEWFE